METIKDKVERYKATAELFLKDNIPVYIKDTSDNFYFGDILLVGDNTITVKCFSPTERAGQKYTIYWTLITKFEEYRK